MVAGQREAHELLLIEEADAWFEYLEATRAQSALRYKEVDRALLPRRGQAAATGPRAVVLRIPARVRSPTPRVSSPTASAPSAALASGPDV